MLREDEELLDGELARGAATLRDDELERDGWALRDGELLREGDEAERPVERELPLVERPLEDPVRFCATAGMARTKASRTAVAIRVRDIALTPGLRGDAPEARASGKMHISCRRGVRSPDPAAPA